MRGIHKIFTRTATAGAVSAMLATGLLAGLAFAPGARAQNTWSLPDPTASATPHAQGPIDAQNPVARPTVVAPSPSPVPTITPPAPSPAATQAPRERPSAAPRPTAAPSAQPTATPTVTPTRAPVPRATEAATTPSPTASAQPAPVAATSAPNFTPVPAPSEVADAEPAPQVQESWSFWWWAVPLALLVAAGIFALLRRRDPAVDATEWPEAAEPDAPAPDAPAIVPAEPEPQPAPARPVVPEPVATPAPAAPIAITFEPVALRLSLVYATLQYRLTLTAAADLPAAHLLGDMIGAHGSIPVEQQLAPALEALTRLKALAPLAAGETATVAGELRLPLGAIVPVRQGNASLFVPLVRLCLVADDGAPGERRVFTVGTVGGPALAPLRLDTGPNEHRDLAAREVEAARAYPVQQPVAG